MESQIVTLEGELQGKDEKIAQFDAQVSLAIGERDAVQLEARTQVEDFEEKIKVMQEQLQKVIDLKLIYSLLIILLVIVIIMIMKIILIARHHCHGAFLMMIIVKA